VIRAALRCWRTVLGAHAGTLLFSLVFAGPAWSVAAGAVGLRAEGDLALWRAGGVLLADTVSADGAALGRAAEWAGFGAALWVLVSVPISAGLFATLRRGRDLGAAGFATAAAGRAGPLLAVLAASSVTLAAVGAGGALAASAVWKAFAETPDPRRGILLAGLAALPFLGALLVLGAATDVARSAVVGGRARPVRTLFAAQAAAMRRPLRFTAPYAAFATTSLALAIVGAALATRLGGRPGPAAAALFAISQAVLAARALLRASWMAAAARLSGALDRPGAGS
jgi:hypothetical protein